MPPEIRQVYRVTTLVGELRNLLETSYRAIWIEGEVSGLASPSSGHLYFSLKENGALLRCAFFRNRRVGSSVPREGMQVLVRGQISVYQSRGDLQLIVHYLEPAGDGMLRLAFEAMKRKLSEEGLFDAKFKQEIPAFPGVIAVITSTSGAALHDILVTLRRRYPPARVIVLPTAVQGEAAPAGICNMLEQVALLPHIDVVIIARGGGSLEDLQAFNDEQVARSIYRCPVPVVSGVGHETDMTIADLVADRRAATPTAAAELATPESAEIRAALQQRTRLIHRQMDRRLNDSRQRVDQVTTRLVHPSKRLEHQQLFLDSLLQRLGSCIRFGLNERKHILMALQAGVLANRPGQHLGILRERNAAYFSRMCRQVAHGLHFREQSLKGRLEALTLLGPSRTLNRGYAILRNHEQHVVASVSATAPGETLSARVADGAFQVKVLSSD
jgi:exodeoxyribonuclease VII large subunit